MGSVVSRVSQGYAYSNLIYDISTYSAYGNLRLYNDPNYGGQTAPPDAVGYGGQWGNVTDVEANLVLMGFRFYSPQYCRFLTRDPQGYEGGINLYAYCRNNPINCFDPMGLDGILQSILSWSGNAISTPFRWAWHGLSSMTRPKMRDDAPTLQKAYIDPDLPESLQVNSRYSHAGHAVNNYIDETAVTILQALITEQMSSLSNLTKSEMLSMKFGTEELLSQAVNGEGEAIIGAGTTKTLFDGPRLAAQYGGKAEDWAKMTVNSTRRVRGRTYSIHYYQNAKLGVNTEYKTILGR